MFLKLKSPILVQWEVTYDCNKNCIHCYNYWRDSTTQICNEPYFNEAVCKRVTEDIINNDIFQVVITGGEPLLVFNKIYPYLKKLREHNIRLLINSNLSYINDDIINKLKELNVKTILTSLPASNAELDCLITNNPTSFVNTVQNIKKVISNGINVTPNMVLTQKNFNDIYNNAKLVKSLGCKNFSVSRAIQPANCNDFSNLRLTKEQFLELPNILSDIKNSIDLNIYSIEGYPLCFTDNNKLRNDLGFSRLCMAGKTFCVISPDGEIRPCILLSESYKEPLKSAWDKMESYRDDSLLPKECLHCKMKDQCAGGCKAERLHTRKTYNCIDEIANPEIKDKITLSTNPYNKISCSGKTFIRNSELLFRKEEFGGIVYLSNSRFAPVTPQLFEFLKSTHEFTFDNILEKITTSIETAENILNKLLIKRIIKIKE